MHLNVRVLLITGILQNSSLLSSLLRATSSKLHHLVFVEDIVLGFKLNLHAVCYTSSCRQLSSTLMLPHCSRVDIVYCQASFSTNTVFWWRGLTLLLLSSGNKKRFKLVASIKCRNEIVAEGLVKRIWVADGLLKINLSVHRVIF